MNSVETAADRLRALLQQEKALLIGGRAGEAAGLVNDKMQAMEALESALFEMRGHPGLKALGGVISSVQAMAKENAIHFEAVRNGLNSAASRLGNLGSATTVGSYGQDGRRVEFTGAAGGYFKRV